jgi:putative ABC transport system substrate-binding protein
LFQGAGHFLSQDDPVRIDRMNRRAFITLVSGAAAWPLAARAQQAAMPVIGYISNGSLESDAVRLAAFRQGLGDTGYVEGRSVAIEYRGMQGHYDLLPAFIADFVRRPVAVIVAGGSTPGALAAKGATSTIPIVFSIGVDPVQIDLVASFNRPGGNVTGISNLQNPLVAKRLELLRQLVPGAAVVAVIENPSSPAYTQYEITELRQAADSLGLQLLVLNASTVGEIDAAFAALVQARPSALLISSESFFLDRREQIVALATRQPVPAMYPNREFAAAGGLMSYGTSTGEIYRQMGIYAGRVLKGEKPGDLPVQQAAKVELILNLKTAKALGITVPLSLLTRADEVIE